MCQFLGKPYIIAYSVLYDMVNNDCKPISTRYVRYKRSINRNKAPAVTGLLCNALWAWPERYSQRKKAASQIAIDERTACWSTHDSEIFLGVLRVAPNFRSVFVVGPLLTTRNAYDVFEIFNTNK